MARRELTVEPRQVLGKKVAQMRRNGLLPGNIYGHGTKSVAVQVDAATVQRALKEMARNEVIDLKVAGERSARPAVVHHVQRHPTTSHILHLDFYQVSLREKMRADVPVVLVGESEAVKTFNGVLLQPVDAVHVEALPLDIPDKFEVDISVLRELETSIHVRDLTPPEKVAILTDADVVLARVASPRVSVEEEEAAAAAAAEAPVAAEEAATKPEAAEAPESE